MAAIVEAYMKECAKRRAEPYYGFIEHVDSHAIDSDIDFVSDGHLRVLCHVLSSADESSLLTLRLARGQRRDVQHPPVKSQQLVSYRKLLKHYGTRTPDAQTLTKLSIAVAHLLRISPYLQELHLVGLEIGPAGARRLAETIHCALHLASVDLTGALIGDEGAALLLPALATMTHLRELSLCSCELTDASAAALGKVVGSNRQKENVEAWAGSLRGATPNTSRPLGGAETLQSLDVSGNYFGDGLVKVLCTHLTYDSSVRSLNLADNTITRAGAMALMSLLNVNSTLSSVDLSGNIHAAMALSGGSEALLELSPSCSVVATARGGTSAGCVIVRGAGPQQNVHAQQQQHSARPKSAPLMPQMRRTPSVGPAGAKVRKPETPRLGVPTTDGPKTVSPAASSSRASGSRSPTLGAQPIEIPAAEYIAPPVPPHTTEGPLAHEQYQPREQHAMRETVGPQFANPFSWNAAAIPQMVIPMMPMWPPQSFMPPSGAFAGLPSGNTVGEVAVMQWTVSGWQRAPELEMILAEARSAPKPAAQSQDETHRQRPPSAPVNVAQLLHGDAEHDLGDHDGGADDAEPDASKHASGGLDRMGVPGVDAPLTNECHDEGDAGDAESPDGAAPSSQAVQSVGATSGAAAFVSPEVQKYFGEILDVYEAHLTQQTKATEAQLRKQTEALRALERKMESLQLRPVLPPKRETRVVLVRQEDYPGHAAAAEQLESTLKSLLNRVEDQIGGGRSSASAKSAAPASSTLLTGPTRTNAAAPVGASHETFVGSVSERLSALKW